MCYFQVSSDLGISVYQVSILYFIYLSTKQCSVKFWDKAHLIWIFK